jgi:Flp pilus assembly protein TadG
MSLRSKDTGQIMVLFAVFLVVLLILAGSAFDYASIVIDNAQLQNAADAALLAGSDSLSRHFAAGPGPAQQTALAVSKNYLQYNGVDTTSTNTTYSITFPTSTPVAGVPTPATPVPDNLKLSVARQHQTAFWPLIGVPEVTVNGGGQARAARGLIDVVVAIDTTLSEQNSQSIPQLQNAADQFVQAMAPDLADPRGPRIAIVRFQGEKCTQWPDNFGTYKTSSCVDDVTVLTDPSTSSHPTYIGPSSGATILSSDRNSLERTALDNVTTGSCMDNAYACGLDYVKTSSDSTRLSNPLNVVLQGNYVGQKNGLTCPSVGCAAFGSNYLFTASGSRNDNSVGGAGYAKKVLIMMTDGQNQVPTHTPNGTFDANTWDTDAMTSAATLRAGPDTQIGTADDVEIYTINFQCAHVGDYQSSTCMSALASRGPGNYQCGTGSTSLPGGYSASDWELMQISSSKRDGSGNLANCDHYFPLLKNDSLPQLFRQLAGTISRGALTQ